MAWLGGGNFSKGYHGHVKFRKAAYMALQWLIDFAFPIYPYYRLPDEHASNSLHVHSLAMCGFAAKSPVIELDYT